MLPYPRTLELAEWAESGEMRRFHGEFDGCDGQITKQTQFRLWPKGLAEQRANSRSRFGGALAVTHQAIFSIAKTT